ncbi:transcriptional regulator, AraC family [Burkholderia pseudomallei MSHR684]|nr:transcriptional regulator, AraC family [Burkholderia pseudomallei MSHR684]
MARAPRTRADDIETPAGARGAQHAHGAASPAAGCFVSSESGFDRGQARPSQPVALLALSRHFGGRSVARRLHDARLRAARARFACRRRHGSRRFGVQEPRADAPRRAERRARVQSVRAAFGAHGRQQPLALPVVLPRGSGPFPRADVARHGAAALFHVERARRSSARRTVSHPAPRDGRAGRSAAAAGTARQQLRHAVFAARAPGRARRRPRLRHEGGPAGAQARARSDERLLRPRAHPRADRGGGGPSRRSS